MKGRDKEFVQKIALERMYRLMDLALENWKEHKERSRDYLGLMKRISTRNRVRIPRELKEKYCKKCFALLEGNSTVRVKGKALWLKCKGCGTVKKIFLEGKKSKIVIGVTGGIACGKSIVAEVFEKNGAEVLKADDIAKELMVKDRKLNGLLKEKFGEKIAGKKRIDFSELGRIVFADPKKMHELNALVHPVTIKKLKELIQKSKKDFVVIESALLVEEKNALGLTEKLVVVWSNKEKQLERLKKKGLSERGALQKINSQLPVKEKLKKADIAIENNASEQELREKAAKAWIELSSN
ncbi:MAG: dephospho-CoA kinase [Candidatus Diapherotrites archaeon]